MGLIKCPNCNKYTFDDQKCKWCNYTLKEQENYFDKEIYTYLKNEYSKKRIKPEIIKLGMSKFNLSMSESKSIVDFIANELYEKENYKSYDEINNTENYKTEIYKFSFIQYFIRNFVFKIILITLLVIIAIQNYNPTLSVLLIITSFILFIFFLYKLAIAATSIVIIEPNRINYYYTSSYNNGPSKNKDDPKFDVYSDHNHYIEIISSLTQSYNYIFIKGKIKCSITKHGSRSIWYESV